MNQIISFNNKSRLLYTASSTLSLHRQSGFIYTGILSQTPASECIDNRITYDCQQNIERERLLCNRMRGNIIEGKIIF